MADLPSGTITFLFTDIEGSTSLWERDPEVMQIALELHNSILYEAIGAHSGRVFKIVGDSFQAAFALPAQAIKAAVAAQHKLIATTWGATGPLRVRMGLHTGPAETRGSDYAVSHTLNRVARLMSAGHGGQILLTNAVAELVGEHPLKGVSLREMGKHHLKGMSRPEILFQVVAEDLPSDFPPLHTLDTPIAASSALRAPPGELSMLDRIGRGQFVCRERELAQAAHAWQAAASGQGQVLLVSGEPGVGKSRLVLELATRIEIFGGRVLVGESFAEGGAPYTPIAQIARVILGDRLPLALPNTILADLLTLAPDQRARYPDVPPNPPLDPQAEQMHLFESLVACCTALAGQAPLMLFLDDIHWADSGTLHLLRHLARRTRRQKILIVAAYREVELDEARPLHEVLLDLNRARLATRIKLARFTNEETRKLLAALFSEEITAEFLDGIYHETEGNPFFIEEVCKTLVESRKLYFQEGHWQRPKMAEMEIPQSLRLAIQIRLGKLSPATQETLLVAAVIGREFDFEILLKASNSSEEDLITALEEAGLAQLIQEARGKVGEVFSFIHALVPMSLRESLSVLRRHRLHRKVGESIQALRADDYEALAYHYSQAGDEERAFPFFLQAGKRAAAAYANQEAEKYYRAALEITGGGTERGELLSELGRVLARLGRFPEAIQTWREAVALYLETGDHDQVAWLYARMARAAWYSSGPSEGLGLCQEGLSAMPAGMDSAQLAYLLHEAGRAYEFSNQHAQALQFCQRALEMARQHDDPATQAEALTTIGLIPVIDTDQALQALEEAIQIAETAGLLNQASRAHNNLGWVYHVRIGDIQKARQHYQRAAEIDRPRGDLTDYVFSQSAAAYCSLLLGETRLAQASLPESRQLLPSSPTPGIAEISLEMFEASVFQLTGQLERAKDTLEKSRKEVLAKGYTQGLVFIALELGTLLNRIGETERAEAILKEGHQAGEFISGDNELRNALIEILLRQGKFEEARIVHAEAEKTAADFPSFMNDTFLTWGEARLAAGEKRWDSTLGKYAQLGEALEARGLRLWLAQLLRESAEVYLSREEPGDSQQARQLLQKALALYEEMEIPYYGGIVKARLGEIDG